jgi:hypothetical protein
VEPTLSRGMRQLNGVYTQESNRRHRRTGHVFQSRFKAVLVERDAYLLELARYVVLNPVRAKVVRRAQDWPWSGYRATAGLEDAPSFLTIEWLLKQFSGARAKAQKAYRKFVSQGRGVTVWENLRGQIYLGSASFIEEHAPGLAPVREIPNAQLETRQPPLSAVVTSAKDGPGIARTWSIATRSKRSPTIWVSTTRRSAEGFEPRAGRGCGTLYVITGPAPYGYSQGLAPPVFAAA